jgi:hypothetical protein
MTHKTIDRIITLANAIASDADAAIDCPAGVLIEIERQLDQVQRQLSNARARMIECA